MKTISVKKAHWVADYVVEIVFNDNKKKQVDFGAFLNTHSHPQYNKYKKTEQFKKFTIENGNLVWGKDWDMIFPVFDLYRGKIWDSILTKRESGKQKFNNLENSN